MHRRGFLRAGLLAGAGVLEGAALLQEERPLAGSPLEPLRLNSNENALGPSPKARRALIEGLDEAGRYPFRYIDPLIEALAGRHGVEKESVVLGNGSSEVIQMAVQALADSRLVVAEPTFEIAEGYARAAGVEVRRIPLDGDFSHDLEAMQRAAVPGSLVYVCNPNNPTGTLTSCRQLEEWISAAPEQISFLVDEAYFDYVTDRSYWSMTRRISTRKNVVVTRTFSKVYGMAGLRLGYGLTHPETAQKLQDLASDVNTSQPALVAGAAALQDKDFVQRSLDSNERGKRILCQCLDELGLQYTPSQANFVLHQVKGDLTQYIERMRDEGVRVGRAFAPLLSYNRVSIGLPEEMEIFTSKLRKFRDRGWI